MKCADCGKDKCVWSDLHPMRHPDHPDDVNKNRLVCYECLHSDFMSFGKKKIDYTVLKSGWRPWDCQNCYTNLAIYSENLSAHEQFHTTDDSTIVKCGRCGCFTRVIDDLSRPSR